MPYSTRILVCCTNCRMMELNLQECKILIDLEDNHFFIYHCPECGTRGEIKLHAEIGLRDYFEKTLGVRTFRVPSESISELEIADFVRKLDSEVDLVELAEAGL